MLKRDHGTLLFCPTVRAKEPVLERDHDTLSCCYQPAKDPVLERDKRSTLLLSFQLGVTHGSDVRMRRAELEALFAASGAHHDTRAVDNQYSFV